MERMEEKLIELVRDHPILYDKTKAGYRREDLKTKTWINIAKELKKSEEEVRKRWKTLRDRFNRARKAKSTSTGSAAGSPKRQGKFYNSMAFLLDVPCVNNRTASNFVKDSGLSASELFENFSPDLDISADGSLLFNENFNCDEAYSQFSNESQFSKDSSDPQTTNSISPEISSGASFDTPQSISNVPIGRKRRSLHSEVLLQNTHQEMNKLLKTATRTFEGVSTSSPMQLFFLSLAKEVDSSEMSCAQKSELQVKVLTLVKNEIGKATQN